MANSIPFRRSLRRKQTSQPVEENVQAPALTHKERIALKRKAAKERKALIRYTVTSLFASALAGVLLGLLAEPKLGVGATFALLCLTLSFKYPRQAIYAFIIYIPFSGTVTYALGGSSILQLAKDAFYVPAVIGVIQFCRKNRLPILIPKSIKLPVGILLTICLFTLVLVNGAQELEATGGEKPFLMGILGLKILLGYLLMITCIYYLIRNKEDLYFLLRTQVVLILVCCGLCFVQYLMLKTGICRGTVGVGETLFKASLQSKCFVGGSLLYTPSHGQIRLPGTFVAPWQWGWFLISSAFFSFGTAFSDRSPFWRMMGLYSMAAVFIMAVLSGQRIALGLVPVAVVTLLLLTGQIANLKRFVPIGIGLGLILGFLMIKNPEVVQQRWQSFQDRWNASPPHEFVKQQFLHSIKDQDGLFGNGLGRGTNATRVFGEVRLIETYHPKVLFEIGPLGLLSVLVLYTALTVAVFKAYRATKEPDLRGYAASMWVFVLFISYFPYYYALDVDPVNVYYWLAAGIALKLPEIDRLEKLEQSLDDPNAKLNKRKLKRLKKSAKFS